MKLLELEVENFGVFAGRTFSFGAGGFQLVYGENEAGKTTLLQLIRELLFGFPHVNQFAFDEHTGEIAATARLALHDATAFSFRRRKGRRDTVIGKYDHNGKSIDEPALATLCGSATMELYRHVFAFSLAELATGQKSLEHAKLNEALYGGGMGGLANFQRVQQQLQAEQESLYAPRGQKRTINHLIKQIKDTKRRLRDASIKPQDYAALVKQHAELATEADDQRRKLDELRRRRARQQRLIEALPKWRQISVLNAEKAKLTAPLGFPHNGAEEYRRAKETFDAINDNIAASQADIQEKSTELAAIDIQPAIVANQAEIKTLCREVGKIQGFREDLPKRAQESVLCKEQVAAQLRNLNPHWDFSHLEKFQTSLAQRASVEQIKQRFDDWEIAHSGLVSQRCSAAEELAHLEQQRDALGETSDLGEAEYVVQNAGEYQSQCRQIEELHQQIAEAEEAIDSLARRLNRPLASAISDFSALAPPLAATIQHFQREVENADRSFEQSQRKLADAEEGLQRARDELSQLESQRPIPTREQLLEIRRRRDQGWSLVRRRYIDKQPLKELNDELQGWLGEPEAKLADAFQDAVSQADALADERQTLAELAAGRDRLAIEIEQGEQRLERAKLAHGQAARHRQSVLSQWRQTTEKCSLAPLSPVELNEWLRDYESLLDLLKQRAQWSMRADRLVARQADFESRLQKLFSRGNRAAQQDIDDAKRLVDRAQKIAATRNHLNSEIPRLQQKLKSLDERLVAHQQHKDNLQRQWERLLAELELPQHYSASVASTLLNELAAARQQHEKALVLDRRIADMQAGAVEFHQRVARVCQAAGVELEKLPPEDAILQLDRRLEETRQNQARQARLEAELAAEKQRLNNRKQSQKTHQQKMQQLFKAAEVNSEADFWRVAEAAARRHVLDQEVASLQRELHILRENEGQDNFAAALEHADPDILADELRQLGAAVDEYETKYKQAVEKAAIVREEVGRMDGESLAAQIAVELESLRSELNAAVDRWATLVLAQKLMKDAIVDFEQKHQPQMLQDVERLFRELTLGRYTSIRRKLDEQGTLQVQERGGGLKEPHQLSTGTREQLYLAIRLAYILHYCKSAEPLPIIMDDVLVNFDDRRARQTLRVLLEIAKDLQIIFMTCHQSTVELAQAEMPDCPVLHLSLAAAPRKSAAVRRAK